MDNKLLLMWTVAVVAMFFVGLIVSQQARLDGFANGYVCAFEHENEQLDENYLRAYEYEPTDYCRQYYALFDELNKQNYSSFSG